MRPVPLHAVLWLCLCAPAASAECEKIGAAMLAVEDAPGVWQKTFSSPDGRTLLSESIKRPEALYLREGGGQWRRMPFGSAQRKTQAEEALRMMPLSECRGPRALDDGGMKMLAYDYAQPDPMKDGAITHSAIWLDVDGRVRRLVLEDGSYQSFDYGVFDAPAVVSSRRAKAK